MKLFGSKHTSILGIVLIFGMNSQYVSAASSSSTSAPPPPYNYGAPVPDPCKAKNDAQGAVDEAQAACVTWAKQFEAKKGKTKKHNSDSDDDSSSSTGDDDPGFDKEIQSILTSTTLDKKALQTCQEEYGTSGACKMPMKDADSDDADADDDTQVYDKDAKGPSNSPTCKAQYAKKFSQDRKADFETMTNAETKSTEAQKAVADAMSTEQTSEMEVSNKLQAVQPKLQADLMKMREGMTHQEQATRTKINELLGQISQSTVAINTLERQIADLDGSYMKTASNLLLDCKLRIRNSDSGGGVGVANMNYLSNCVTAGGLGNCKCAKDNKFLADQESLRETDQDKRTNLRSQLAMEHSKVASLQNTLTNSRTDLDEDVKMARDEAAQLTQNANTEAQQLNKQLNQMQQTAQQSMSRLQAAAKRAQDQYEKAKKDYAESDKGYKDLKAYAGKSSSDDDPSTGADPQLTKIIAGVENWNASRDTACSTSAGSGTIGGGTASQTTTSNNGASNYSGVRNPAAAGSSAGSGQNGNQNGANGTATVH